MGSLVFLIPTPLPLPLRIAVWKSLTTIAPPIFYIVAAEKDMLKHLFCTDSAVHPLVI